MYIILASNSPRRKEILTQLNLTFEVIPSNFEEALIDMEPHALAEHFAYMKALDVYKRMESTKNDDGYIIGSDTVVYCGRIMGKPENHQDAYNMLRELSGKKHQVISGISVIERQTGNVITKHEVTDVWIRSLSDREIYSYIESSEPRDKAGSYGIQGLGALFVEKIHGCYFNVVGLPVNKLYQIMKQFGFDLI